jgi:thiamine biosynthesis protein ThiI
MCLLSSGIDSPVAAHMIASRGAQTILFHMDNFGPCDPRTLDVVRGITNVLRADLDQEMPLLVAPYHLLQDRIGEMCERSYHCVMCKRYMLLLAREMAKIEGAEAIVTGDSLGQVASQTLQNILVEQKDLDFPVIRPLIGLDKIEIETIAKKIGTYELSVTKLPDCRYVPRKPKTSASERSIDIQEERLSPGNLLDQLVSMTSRISP